MHRIREKIHSLLKSLFGGRGGSLFHAATKRFNESAANHVVDIYTASFLLFFMIGTFSFVGVYSARTYVDLTITFTYALYALLIIWLPIIIFELFYVGPRIIRQITKYSPMIQYKVLLISRKPVWISFLPLPFLIFVIVVSRFVPISVVGELGDALIPRLYVMSTVVGLLLMALSFPWNLVLTLTRDEEATISVGLIRHVELIISENKKREHDPSADIWMHLVRKIFSKCKVTLKNHTRAAHIDLHRPFGIISLAFIMGERKKRTEVRECVANLGAILTDKRLTEATKSEKLLDKLENIDQEKEFSESKVLYEKLGFDYDFEPFWTKSGWKTAIFLIIIEAVPAIIGVIEFFRRGL